MLTQNDIDQIREIVKEEIKFLPSKDEFYEKMDEVMVELKAIREEQTTQSYKLSNHEDRIVKLEEITLSTAR